MNGQSSLELRPAAIVDGRYELRRHLGAGGMGYVFLCTDLLLENGLVALKFLYPHLMVNEGSFQRFRNEVMVARKLMHPNIVRTYNISLSGEHPYLSMEYVEGETLKKLIATEHPQGMSSERALQIFGEICSAVRHSHLLGVIHRDIKPDNVMMGSSGPKVGDFGLAAMLRRETQMTRTGQVMGSPPYMAPELFRGSAADGRTDIYALGILLYELLFGVVPFQDRSLYGLGRKHETEVLPAPSCFADPLQQVLYRIVEGCVMKRPEERYRGVPELFDDLKNRSEAFRAMADTLPSGAPALSAVSEAVRKRPLDWVTKAHMRRIALAFVLVMVIWTRGNPTLRVAALLPIFKIERVTGMRLGAIRAVLGVSEFGPPVPMAVEATHRDLLWARLVTGDDPNSEANRQGKSRTTPLQLAVMSDIRLTAMLLRFGADPNTSAAKGVTALQLATLGFSPDIVQLLLEHGARPNDQNAEGDTALSQLVRRLEGHLPTKSVYLLLEHGADPTIRNKMNRDALSYAAESTSDAAEPTSQATDSASRAAEPPKGTEMLELLLQHTPDHGKARKDELVSFAPESMKAKVAALFDS